MSRWKPEPPIVLDCANCGKTFTVICVSRKRAINRRFCSLACAYTNTSTPQAILARLLKHIEVSPTGCWLWRGYSMRKGYGSSSIGSNSVSAHRVSYIAFKGSIPDGIEIDHLCRVKHCVNPDHLEAVTPQINKLRARETQCRRGHALEGDNVVGASRRCRKCMRMRQRLKRWAVATLEAGEIRR